MIKWNDLGNIAFNQHNKFFKTTKFDKHLSVSQLQLSLFMNEPEITRRLLFTVNSVWFYECVAIK